MILFRSCPKCSSGDLVKTKDAFGQYMECAQCGYVKILDVDSVDDQGAGIVIPFPMRVGEDDPPWTA